MTKPQVTRLPNGMRLITYDMPSLSSVTVLAMVGVGSRFEAKNNIGISHFLEHLPFKGTENYPSSLALAEAIDGVGGKHNAFTSKEYTGYWVKLAAEKLALALDVVSDLLLTPRLRPEDIEMERGVILEEINMYEDDPQSKVGLLFDELVYAGSPLGWSTAGYKETVSALEQKDFLRHYNAYYDPTNVVVGVVGNLKSQNSNLKTEVEKYFSKGKERKGGGRKQLGGGQQTLPRVKVFYKKTEQAHFHLGYPGFGWDDERKHALLIMSTILGGNSSAWLFNEIREKRGLAYYAYAGSDLNQKAGSLVAYEGVKLDKIEEAITVTLEQFAKMAEGKVKQSEVDRAKEYIVGKTSLDLEDSAAMANLMVRRLLLENKAESVETMLQKVQAVTTDQVKAVARDIVVNSRLNLALVGPFKDDGKFTELILA